MKKQTRQIDISTTVELREENGKQTIVGIIPFNSRSVKIGWFTEVVTETAFAKTLSDGADVKALYAHDTAKILGRTKNDTLRLSVGMMGEVKGLICECDLSDTSYARDVYALIKRNDVNTMSFAFDVIKERVEVNNGEEVRYLLEVKLYEVSFAVVFPAYEATNSEARELRGIDLDKLETILEKEPTLLTAEDRSALANVNKIISTLIEPMPQSDTPAVPDTEAVNFAASLLAASKGKE